MDHLVILNKSWGMLPKILDGRKIIESRWYVRKKCPFDCVKEGDNLYFKNSGEPVMARAKVSKVLQFENLDKQKIAGLINKYGEQIGIEKMEFDKYIEQFKNKKFALMVFMGKPEKIKSFDVDKSKAGVCSRSAWAIVDNINNLKVE
jgi:hypothetical protein